MRILTSPWIIEELTILAASRNLQSRSISADMWKAIIGGLGLGVGGVAMVEATRGRPFWKKIFPGLTRRDVRPKGEDKHQKRTLEKRLSVKAVAASKSFLPS